MLKVSAGEDASLLETDIACANSMSKDCAQSIFKGY
jgi:hypothetical protein